MLSFIIEVHTKTNIYIHAIPLITFNKIESGSVNDDDFRLIVKKMDPILKKISLSARDDLGYNPKILIYLN